MSQFLFWGKILAMKSFLYLIEANLTSGASKCALELINHLKKTNYKPIVITQHRNDFNDFCDKIGVENYHFHYARICSMGMGLLGWLIAYFDRPFLNFLALKYLEKKIDFSKISFIHSNGASIDFGAYIFKKKKIPHIWHVRDFYLFNKKWPPVVSNFPQYMEKNSTHIITVSKALKDYMLQQGFSTKKIKPIYDGIEINYPPNRKKNIRTNKEILNVVCVGQLCELKGQEILIDAIAQMSNQERNHFKFDFWGSFMPGEKKHIIEKIKINNLEEYVNFKGYSKNISAILPSYDIGIQPSHSEGFSRVTVEYMVSGLCVIAEKEGAIPELIQNNEQGLLYQSYDSNELKNLLLYCYNNQNKMQKIATNAQNKASKLYNLKNNLNNIVELYNQIT